MEVLSLQLRGPWWGRASGQGGVPEVLRDIDFPAPTLNPSPYPLPLPCFPPLNPSMACSGICRSRKQQKPGLGEGHNQNGGCVRGNKPRHPLDEIQVVQGTLSKPCHQSCGVPDLNLEQQAHKRGEAWEVLEQGCTGPLVSGEGFCWKWQVHGEDQGMCREQEF